MLVNSNDQQEGYLEGSDGEDTDYNPSEGADSHADASGEEARSDASSSSGDGAESVECDEDELQGLYADAAEISGGIPSGAGCEGRLRPRRASVGEDSLPLSSRHTHPADVVGTRIARKYKGYLVPGVVEAFNGDGGWEEGTWRGSFDLWGTDTLQISLTAGDITVGVRLYGEYLQVERRRTEEVCASLYFTSPY